MTQSELATYVTSISIAEVYGDIGEYLKDDNVDFVQFKVMNRGGDSLHSIIEYSTSQSKEEIKKDLKARGFLIEEK